MKNSLPRIAGILFLLQLIPYFIAHEQILGSYIYSENFLIHFLEQRITIHLAVVLELISGFSFIGFTVIVVYYLSEHFPVLSRFYFGVRLVELALIVLSNIAILGITSLAARYKEDLTLVETLTIGIRSIWIWTNLVLMIIFGTNAIALYYMLLKTRIVPKFISQWGLLAAPLAILGPILLLFTDYSPPFILYVPIGLNEFFLAFWLVFKGMNLNIQAGS